MTSDQAREELQKYWGWCPLPERPSTATPSRRTMWHVKAPPSANPVAEGTTVEYYLSLGPEGTEVPYVVGQSEGDATATLENKGFHVSVEQERRSDEPAGTVIEPDVLRAVCSRRASTVNIVVSTGPEKKTMYSVGVNYSSGGTVSATASSVEEGGSFQVTITPNSGYEVRSVSGLGSAGASVRRHVHRLQRQEQREHIRRVRRRRPYPERRRRPIPGIMGRPMRLRFLHRLAGTLGEAFKTSRLLPPSAPARHLRNGFVYAF